LNDFKSVEGDRRTGIGSLPVRLGIEHAARVACVFMALPQLAVAALLVSWGRLWQAGAIMALLFLQLLLMMRLMAAPGERAPWYNATGTSLFVIGMLIAAFAVRPVMATAS
jgi:chlorophyll synthase